MDAEQQKDVSVTQCRLDNQKNLERWMEQLPDNLHSVPLHNLAIPGSHDSCSYSINPTSDIAPDEPNLYNSVMVQMLGCMSKRIIYNWSRTQVLSCFRQMEAGIRYFDLRVAAQKETNSLNIVHGLYGTVIPDILKEMKSFLQSHTKEILLLDFQHFYNMDHDDHHSLLHQLTEVFGALLCPSVSDLEKLTLSWLWERGFQVLVFYRNSVAQYHPFLWPADCIPNPWPDTSNTKSLFNFLSENYMNGRPSNKFYVTQGILTPTACFILWHIFGNLRNDVGVGSNGELSKWLNDKQAGSSGLNIVICDFIEMNGFDIPRSIVNLNYKSLESSTATERAVGI